MAKNSNAALLKLAADLHPAASRGLMGAGVGAAAGALPSLLGWRKRQHMLQDAVTGAAVGGLGGAVSGLDFSGPSPATEPPAPPPVEVPEDPTSPMEPPPPIEEAPPAVVPPVTEEPKPSVAAPPPADKPKGGPNAFDTAAAYGMPIGLTAGVGGNALEMHGENQRRRWQAGVDANRVNSTQKAWRAEGLDPLYGVGRERIAAMTPEQRKQFFASWEDDSGRLAAMRDPLGSRGQRNKHVGRMLGHAGHGSFVATGLGKLLFGGGADE